MQSQPATQNMENIKIAVNKIHNQVTAMVTCLCHSLAVWNLVGITGMRRFGECYSLLRLPVKVTYSLMVTENVNKIIWVNCKCKIQNSLQHDQNLPLQSSGTVNLFIMVDYYANKMSSLEITPNSSAMLLPTQEFSHAIHTKQLI